ncbi:MAG: hypothetical protein OXC02_06405 [Rhodobacteraceae bacterium]|nr:hypothetical protein [Paracoccaceae bacterium]
MDSSTQVVVSLTTTPPRFQLVGETLQLLLDQDFPAHQIELYIPKTYRRFQEHSFCVPEVPDGITVKVVENDLGPATKVLPCVQNYRGHNTRIIYCDDDRSYPPYWLKRLIHTTKNRPDECIAAMGYTVDMFGFKRKAIHRKPRIGFHGGGIRNIPKNIPFWLSRIAYQIQNRTLQKPTWLYKGGYVDIAEGFGGVSVSPDFFSQEVYEIPPLIWAHDDIWLSGHFEVKGIGIWVDEYFALPGVFKRFERPEIADTEPLEEAVIEGVNRKSLTNNGINHFRDNYGIWK